MKNKKTYLTIICIISSLTSLQVYANTWYPGSLHQHTGYSTQLGIDFLDTSDDCEPRALEFNLIGYSVAELANQAEQAGLSYLGFSDHSYCIDSNEFQTVRDDCSDEDSARNDFTCIMGEEVSTSDVENDDEPILVATTFCENPNTGEAHISAYGINSIITQFPPSRHCPTIPTPQGGINEIIDQGGISILNHPHPSDDTPSFIDFESVFDVSGETGVEIWNGEWDETLLDNTLDRDPDNLNTWITLLLRGDNVYAYGGTDTHSDVSTDNSNFAFLDGSLNPTNLNSSLRTGKVTVSNNGLVWIEAKGQNQAGYTMQGGTATVCSGDKVTIRPHYSNVQDTCNLVVFKGRIDQGSEDPTGFNFGSKSGTGPEPPTVVGEDPSVTQNSYYRAECIGGSNNEYRIYTNPVWVEISTTDADNDGFCSASDCNDADSTIHPNSAETLCSDGKDNDCDLLTDGSDSDCGGSVCLCGSYVDAGCGAGSCDSNQMLQTRSCNPSSCNTESRCVFDTSCGNPWECRDDETLEQCEHDPTSMVELEITAKQAHNIGSSAPVLVCGRDDCDEDFGYAASFDINDCDNYLDETKENDIVDVDLEWYNNFGASSCKNTDLYFYIKNEENLDDAENYEEKLTDKSNYEKVDEGAGNCKIGFNNLDVTEQYKDELWRQKDWLMAYSWWPEPAQDEWYMQNAGDATVEILYCKPCTDNDGDGYGQDCSLGTDCDDNDPNIYPGRPEICGDSKDNNCNSQTDCADSVCNGQSCGTCMTCSGGTCSGTPLDDTACGVIECGGYYAQSGTESPTATETCYNKQDITSNRCEGFGNCKDANTVDCSTQSNDQPQYSCSTCTFIDSSSCTGTALGSCSFYGTSSLCNSNYACSGSSGGNNAYNNLDYKIPSQGFCDGTGGCDYGSSSPTCDKAEGGEGTSICVDSYSVCQNTCADSIDNDNDGNLDCDDSDCSSDTSCKPFYIKDSSGNNIARFSTTGKLVLKGILEQNSNFQRTSTFAFVIRNNQKDVLIIENNGSMYIDGTLAENQATITSDINRNDFRIKNNGNLVINVNETGYLFLKGTLTQNV